MAIQKMTSGIFRPYLVLYPNGLPDLKLGKSGIFSECFIIITVV